MKVWTVANQKGGAGKTTLAINLAVYAEQMGEVTLLVDIDPQASCAAWQKARTSNRPMVAEVVANNLPAVIKAAENHRLNLVIIDTAPHATRDIVSAVSISDLVICPSQTSVLDLAAMEDTAKVLLSCKALDRAAAVVNNLPSWGAESVFNDAAAHFQNIGFRVAPIFMRSLKAFVRSLAVGQGVVEYEKGQNLAAEDIRKLWDYLHAISVSNGLRRTR